LEKRRYNLGEILPEEPTDMEKLKVDLLNLEKKFVNTELSVAEIKEKLKNITAAEPKGEMEGLTGIKERMEEIEDLIMVEQAALLELKKVIEEKGVGAARTVSVPPEIETLKSTLDDLVSKKAETDSKLQNMEMELRKIRSVTVEKAPEGMIEKLNLLVKETEEKLGRFRVIEEKAREIEMSLGKMKEIGEPQFVKEFSEIKDDLTGLSRKLSETEGSIQKIEEFGKNVDALRSMMDNLTERIVSLEKSYVGIKEMPDLTQKIEEMKTAEIPQAAELSGKISETSAIVQDLTNRLNDLNKRIEMLESTQKSLESGEREVQDITPLVEKRLEEISKEIPSIIESQISPLNKRMDSLEKGLAGLSREEEPEGLKKALEGLEIKITEMEKMLATTEERYRKEFEGIKSIVRESVTKIGAPATFETQLNELMEKTVFLESRLGAIERVVRESIRAQPVVLE